MTVFKRIIHKQEIYIFNFFFHDELNEVFSYFYFFVLIISLLFLDKCAPTLNFDVPPRKLFVFIKWSSKYISILLTDDPR